MRTPGFALLLGVLAMAGCKKGEVGSQPAASSTPNRAAPAASASSSAAPGVAHTAPPPAAAPTGDPVVDLDQKYRDLLGRARKLQQSGDLEGAEQAFIVAAGNGQDIYHRAIGELSFLDLEQGKLPKPEIEAEFLVASGSPAADVRGQVWFNLARLYREMGQPEAERAALARSLASNPSGAAKSKLGKRSACVAELGPRTPSVTPAIVTGWVGVCRELQLCPDPVSEEDARKLSCLESSGSAIEPDTSHGCEGEPPWRSSFRYMQYTLDLAFITPAGPGQFFVVSQRAGGWPAVCGSLYDYAAELAGDTMHVTEQLTASDIGRGRGTPQADSENGVCWNAPEARRDSFFDTKTAKLLATLQTVEGLPVDVTLDSAAKSVELAGGGCDGSVPLDGSNRWKGAPR